MILTVNSKVGTKVAVGKLKVMTNQYWVLVMKVWVVVIPENWLLMSIWNIVLQTLQLVAMMPVGIKSMDTP